MTLHDETRMVSNTYEWIIAGTAIRCWLNTTQLTGERSNCWRKDGNNFRNCSGFLSNRESSVMEFICNKRELQLPHGAAIELTTRQKMRHRLTCSYEWYVDIHRSYGWATQDMSSCHSTECTVKLSLNLLEIYVGSPFLCISLASKLVSGGFSSKKD